MKVFDSEFTEKLLNTSEHIKFLSKGMPPFGLISNMFRRNESTFYIKTDQIRNAVLLGYGVTPNKT